MESIIKQYRQLFSQRGTFSFSHGQRIRDVVRNEEVPNAYGVYIVSGPAGDILYIGRSGKMKNDGSFQGQALRGRITNRQGRLSRQQLFEKILAERQLNSLLFEWFTTFNEMNPVLACLAESQLLQSYFDLHGNLPTYNKQA